MARGGEDNGGNDNHSIVMVALAEYPNLWCANPYFGKGDGLALLDIDKWLKG
jgi:hypothetical protein